MTKKKSLNILLKQNLEKEEEFKNMLKTPEFMSLIKSSGYPGTVEDMIKESGIDVDIKNTKERIKENEM